MLTMEKKIDGIWGIFHGYPTGCLHGLSQKGGVTSLCFMECHFVICNWMHILKDEWNVYHLPLFEKLHEPRRLIDI